MNTCLFCNKPTPRPRYCSTICIKRAWYLRNNPNVKSYFAKNPDFWKTETGIGLKWEKYGAKLLKAKHLLFNNRGSDLDWNGKMVDVKSAKLYKRKLKRGKPYGLKHKVLGTWVFHFENKTNPDFFLCICLIENKPFKILLIPNNNLPRKGITVGWKSYYNKFLIS